MKKKILLTLLIIPVSIFFVLEISGWYLGSLHRSGAQAVKENTGPQKKSAKHKKTKNISLEEQLSALSPKGLYIVIDTSGNRIYLKKEGQTLLEAVVSCGSGNVLNDPSGKKTWVFDTPMGEFSVRSKIVNPIWVKPDWAFFEEGEEIPKNPQDRMEVGMMGKYALALGKGYFIHGTLYTRLLGRNVTHGCVRVGDNDLETIYKQTQIGTKVIIF